MGPALPSAAAPGTAPRGAGSEPGGRGSGGDSGRETAAALGGGRRGRGAGAGTAGPLLRHGWPGLTAAEERPVGVQMKRLTRINAVPQKPCLRHGKEKQTQPASAAFLCVSAKLTNPRSHRHAFSPHCLQGFCAVLYSPNLRCSHGKGDQDPAAALLRPSPGGDTDSSTCRAFQRSTSARQVRNASAAPAPREQQGSNQAAGNGEVNPHCG